MKWILSAWIAVLVAVFGSLSLSGQLQGLHDAVEIGPHTGAIAPEFSLPDEFGHQRNLESLMGPEGLVLVFFRSADW